MTSTALSAFSPSDMLFPESAFPDGMADKLQSKSLREKYATKLVLVIDDETVITDSLVEILNYEGYVAHPFYNGAAAVEFARLRCPDIVLSDVVMPKLNGIDTAIAIRNLCPHARIVLFSGQAGTADIMEEARGKGHKFELLPKPLHPDQLLKKLSALV